MGSECPSLRSADTHSQQAVQSQNYRGVKPRASRRSSCKKKFSRKVEFEGRIRREEVSSGVKRLFGMLRGQPYYQPREDTYMRLIVLLGKSGQPHCANELFSSIHEDGCESTKLYTALITAYCRNNLVEEALSILDEMMNIPNCQPDIITYSTLMEALLDALKFEMVELVYDKMIERSIMPNTLTQNLLLSCYGKAGKFDQMEKIVSRFRRKPPSLTKAP
ncbi:pentatricopeptide repeat-containing protein At3g06430, chloroplastic-like [Vigna radiata var. radiata]|uniref:Pentatricopeptide repeat-containing protein At3g06430, chloroplastic-like n=1 Tax=Vigna radiata var. radiata TaxID=3916 RepID=A0A1S3TXZ7_VIGRR|nr:pentatricopeptide repeat-containing protein At3g06430, chloroplastic-like [Vigna radiata var. radiata]